jgi:hypothetical protein
MKDGNKAILGALALPVIVFSWAWVLSIIWTWFMVPLGVGAISVAHAFGLALVAKCFTGNTSQKDSVDDLPWLSQLAMYAVFRPLIVFLLGWAASGLM